MEALRQYALTLICAALLCSVVLQLSPGGTTARVLRLMCSVVMLFSALVPLSRAKLPDPEEFFSGFTDSGDAAVREGTDMAQQERLMLIKAGLEAYIQDRAAELDCEIHVQVELDSEGYPISAGVQGRISQEQRRILSAVLSNDLGIPEENQQWTVENPKN